MRIDAEWTHDLQVSLGAGGEFVLDAEMREAAIVLGEAGQAQVEGRPDLLLQPGDILLAAEPDGLSLVSRVPARLRVFRFERRVLQAIASRQLKRPSRLAPLTIRLPGIGASLPSPADPGAVIGGASAALADMIDPDILFPVVPSVARTISRMDADAAWPWNVDALTAGSGVTAATLARNFRDCLGESLVSFAKGARLDHVHERLLSQTESRPIAALAIEAGFASPAALVRAYRARFNEPPSETRTRAVGSGRRR